MTKSVVVALLCFSMTFLNPSASLAGLITLQDLSQQRTGRLAQQAMNELDRPEAQARLAAFGITPDEAKMRIAALSEQELQDMANSATGQKAGGDVIVISLTTILLIIIIYLLLR